ncbi:MAG: hypothetical protein ABIF82_09710 [Planctomycetota bacterium]
MLASPAVAGEKNGEEVRRAVKMLRRLELTCTEYGGPNACRLLNAMMLEAVRLYEDANYDPALDSILLARAMFPRGVSITHYGLQPGVVEVAVRWPSKEEEALLPLDPGTYTWVMVAVTNRSGASLRLSGIRAVVEHEGLPLKNSSGRAVESITAGDPALAKVLGPRAAALRPVRVGKGRTVTFPMVFLRFPRWTEIRLVHEPSKIYAPVRNYAAMRGNLARQLRAKRRAVTYLAKIDAARPQPEPGKPPVPRKPKPGPRYVLIGYIRNEIAGAKFGIRIIDSALAKEHKVFYVRQDGLNSAQLSAMGTGAIAELITTGRRPEVGDAVYVLVPPPKQAAAPK